MILRSKRQVRLAFISILQQYFQALGWPVDPQFPEQAPPLPQDTLDFTWAPDATITKISVVEHFPVKLRLYPMVVVDVVSGKGFYRSLNREFQEQLLGPVFINGATQTGVIGERYGGPLDLSVNLKVYDYNIKKVERIVDKLIAGIRFLILEKFHMAGIEIQDINLGSEGQETIGNDQLFVQEVTVDIYTEFEETITVAEQELIDRIQIPDYEGVITEVDGITYPNF